MNRQAQIEEMAHLVCEMAYKPNSCQECAGRKGGCFTLPKMKILHDHGYCKQSDTAREIFEEADKIFMATCLSLETYKAWCELKKKYIQESDL